MKILAIKRRFLPRKCLQFLLASSVKWFFGLFHPSKDRNKESEVFSFCSIINWNMLSSMSLGILGEYDKILFAYSPCMHWVILNSSIYAKLMFVYSTCMPKFDAMANPFQPICVGWHGTLKCQLSNSQRVFFSTCSLSSTDSSSLDILYCSS